IEVYSVEIQDFNGNVKLDKNGKSNFEFIVDAFTTPEKEATTVPVSFDIKTIKIKNSAFSFRNEKISEVLSSNVFDANNLKFSGINAELSLNYIDTDSASLTFNHFSAKEHSGLTLKDLTTNLRLTKRGIFCDFLKIELPHSQINFSASSFEYDSIGNLQHFADRVRLDVPLAKSTLTWADFSAFVPDFKYIKGAATLSGNLTGRGSSLRLQQINLEYEKSTFLRGTIELNGLPDISKTFIYSDIEDFSTNIVAVQDFVANLTRTPLTLPKELGKITYKGNVSGFLSNLVMYGNLGIGAGRIATDISLQFFNDLKDFTFNGSLKSNDFHLGKILNNNDFGKIAFNLNTKGTKKQKSDLKGEITATVDEFFYKDYLYKDIRCGGTFDGRGFDGNMSLKDENIDADFKGKIDLIDKKLPVFDFVLSVRNVNMSELHLLPQYPNSFLTFTASTNIVGNSLDNMTGFLHLDNIKFANNDQTLNVDSINIMSKNNDGNSYLSISSDFVNGEIDGRFMYSTIGQTFTNIVSNYLPVLSADVVKNKEYTAPNQMRIDLSISNLNEIAQVFDLPFSVRGVSVIKGEIDENKKTIDLLANVPALTMNKQKVENFTLSLNNLKNNDLELISRAMVINSNDVLVNFFANAIAANNTVQTRFGWQNTESITNAGEVILNARLARQNNQITAHADILPASLIVSDSTWHIHRSTLDWTAEKSLVVDNFMLETAGQYIKIDGVASEKETDSLRVDINKINLRFLLQLVGFDALDFDGSPTGRITASSVFKKPIYIADIEVDNVTMNGMLVGNARLYSTWDEPQQCVVTRGVFVNGADTVVIADGGYFPVADSLYLSFDARNFGVEFLQQYFSGVVDDFSGTGTGKLRLLGKMKRLYFDGDILVKNGQGTVSLLKTTYTFNDEYVSFRKDNLSVKNLKLYDKDGNVATATGAMYHNGTFGNLNYDFAIAAKNMMALNTQSTDNEYFFGKAYVDGTVQIKGNEDVADFTVYAVSKPNSKIYIRMESSYTATDNSFIRFVSHNDRFSPSVVRPVKKEAKTNGFLTRVSLQIDVTPDMECELTLNPKTNDIINARGEGNLRFEFNSSSDDMRLYGTYTISSGYYPFSLESVLKREFKIERGSSLAWSGDMRNANINIRGIYALTASLRDLLDDSQAAMMRSNVPVNCVLQLTENLMHPTIKFDIELPSSDEWMRQYVRNVVNTEEMMNREILSLLILNRFYKPEYMNTSTTDEANNTSGEALSLATATLNGWLSRMIQNSEFTIGLDVRNDEQTAQYQATINYQPNERLVINGNVGYQTDAMYDEGNRFVGDFDLEYKLTDLGKLRFKAFNHTVDRLGTAKLSQGAGFVYREEFDSVGEMLNYYLGKFTGIFTRKEKNAKDAEVTE
ncbi:MAG: translocation/assembly module TamB, partial [Prevotellaceae bacterium]|nr:translocation/assembly module TamB [Prevotellaceae bacterium]